MRSSRYEHRYVQVADPASVYEAGYTGNPGAIIYYNVGYTAEIVDHYGYDAAGNLTSVAVAESSASDNGDGTITVHDAPATGSLRGSFTYDALNRLVRQEDRDAAGTLVYDRQVAYDARSRVLSEQVSQREGSATVVSQSAYNYTANGERMGAVRRIVTDAWRDGAAQARTTTDYSYRMNTGPVLEDSWSSSPNTPTRYTDYQFGAGDRLERIVLNGPDARTVTVTSDMAGQVLRRSEDVAAAGGDVHDVYYRFAGREIGHVGSRATLDGGYAGSVAERTRAIPTTPAGRADTRHGADLTRALDPVTSFAQGAAGGTYAVRVGDTLAGIAAGLWGDAGLWYKLAQANGMGADDVLAPGRILRVPAGVTRSTYNADTFRAYDPADAIGDLGSLAAPAPRGQKNKCGAFGQILLVAVAVAVSIALPGSGFVAGAVNGAIGSAVSQGLGLATGLQDRFSFKGVALAAIGGGVAGGLGDLAKAADAGKIGGNLAKAAKFVGGSGPLNGAVRGVIASVASQGVGLVTGLQSRFDFAGVATAGVIGGIGNAASRAIGGKPTGFGNQIGSSGASALAGAATRSLLTGTSFGDNVLAVLPDVVGSAIGRAVGGALRGDGTERPQHRSDQAMLEEIFAREGSNQLVGPVDLSNVDFGSPLLASQAPSETMRGRSVVNQVPHFEGSEITVTAKALPKSRSFVFEGGMLHGRRISVPRFGLPDLISDGRGGFGYYAGFKQGGKITFIPGLPSNPDLVALADLTSFTFDLLPLVGSGKAALQVVTGRDVVTGDSVSRIGEAGGIVLGAVPFGRVVGKVGSTLAPALESAVDAVVTKIHKNSLSYVGDTHVYVVRGPDGSLYKVGESAQGVRVGDGASIRAEQQARLLRKETGAIYETEVRRNFGGKADARAYESRFIQTYERLYGKRPLGNPLNR